MAKLQRFRCRSCGYEFQTEVLSKEEVQDRKWRNQPVGDVRCPNPECGRVDLEKI